MFASARIGVFGRTMTISLAVGFTALSNYSIAGAQEPLGGQPPPGVTDSWQRAGTTYKLRVPKDIPQNNSGL